METKTYTYQEPFFTMEVKVEGAFCAFLTVLLTWNAATNLFGVGFLFDVEHLHSALLCALGDDRRRRDLL